jgi:hypothetical protein
MTLKKIGTLSRWQNPNFVSEGPLSINAVLGAFCSFFIENFAEFKLFLPKIILQRGDYINATQYL